MWRTASTGIDRFSAIQTQRLHMNISGKFSTPTERSCFVFTSGERMSTLL